MILITIDGPSGSLKTSMANKLKCNGVRVLHADDFFYPMGTKKHPASGNFNSLYFIKRVLPKVMKEGAFFYQAFDCRRQEYYVKKAEPGRITILEGSYSSTPLLRPYRDLSIFFKTDLDKCHKRVRNRVGEENYQFFLKRWFVDEIRYFSKYRPYKDSIVMEPEYEALRELLYQITGEEAFRGDLLALNNKEGF